MADREMTNEEAIEILGGIRACYNIFDEYDEPKYAALSKAIFTLKAEPAKHGRWINDNGLYKCSVCNNFTNTGWANCIPIEYMNKTMKYCNNCGARMDSEENG